MSLLLENLQKLRDLSKKMRPTPCCKGGIMREVGKAPHRVCSNECQWQELDRLIATAMVDAELG
jgi:hypothetical protein